MPLTWEDVEGGGSIAWVGWKASASPDYVVGSWLVRCSHGNFAPHDVWASLPIEASDEEKEKKRAELRARAVTKAQKIERKG